MTRKFYMELNFTAEPIRKLLLYLCCKDTKLLQFRKIKNPLTFFSLNNLGKPLNLTTIKFSCHMVCLYESKKVHIYDLHPLV